MLSFNKADFCVRSEMLQSSYCFSCNIR